ncbi:hypothetical protein SVAN01_04057 [Stagonosporopsis vannaccii]|nr:hypothetical protein SVAN01_04057 [Stagonosporopsis vannaccii]
MRLQLSTAVLALLPFAIGGPYKEMPSINNPSALEARSAEAANIVSFAPSVDQPFFQITGFDAFMPSAAAANNPETAFSRAVFNLRLMHPDPAKRWTTRCFVHTRGALCDPTAWRDCVQVPGRNNRSEKLRFRFGADMSSVDISRVWNYNGVMLRIGASEPATWIRKTSLEDIKGNMTATELGNWYKRSEAWVFEWKQAVA